MVPYVLSPLGRVCKRSFDCMASSLMTLLFSPAFLACWVAIKCEDGGPAIFSQERIGKGGKPFRIYKFRSMNQQAEAEGPQLASGEDDVRLTRVGRFLRSRHLDELPQLLNVVKGDMAFVGYRPERQYYIEQILEHDPRYADLFQSRPGVTSLATLYNGYTDTMEKMLRRLRYDLFYLNHASIMLDIKILATTFFRIVGLKKF